MIEVRGGNNNQPASGGAETKLFLPGLGSFWQSPRYVDFVRRVTNSRDRSISVLGKDSTERAFLPVLEAEGPVGKVWNSLPFFGGHGDIVSSDSTAVEEMNQGLEELLLDNQVTSFTVVEDPFSEYHVDLPDSLEDFRIGQVSSLEPLIADGEDGLFQMVHKNTRTSIRRSQNGDLGFSSYRDDAVEVLETLHLENMSRIGGRPKPAGFFQLFGSSFERHVDYDIWVAEEKDGTPCASLLVLYFGSGCEYYLPAANDSGRLRQAIYGLCFHAMRHSASRGFSSWNWGGTWRSQSGVYRFKSRWGASDLPYRYQTWITPAWRDRPSVLHGALAHYDFFYLIPDSEIERE